MINRIFRRFQQKTNNDLGAALSPKEFLEEYQNIQAQQDYFNISLGQKHRLGVPVGDFTMSYLVILTQMFSNEQVNDYMKKVYQPGVPINIASIALILMFMRKRIINHNKLIEDLRGHIGSTGIEENKSLRVAIASLMAVGLDQKTNTQIECFSIKGKILIESYGIIKEACRYELAIEKGERVDDFSISLDNMADFKKALTEDRFSPGRKNTDDFRKNKAIIVRK